ncbi:UNVERIFIED_CONTAM: protein PSK SIMULATOR 3 [Sesamum angustifolium]|uniref:Protein PSK SIMULATOR 3 n=1 Tax=Sesamum angustifolium TaxID=2727405 RepID=A0AAW2LFZ7_9LAMI
MVAQSWLRSLWTTSKKHELRVQKAQIAVLAFEAASLMTKLLHLWQSLTDKQVAKLREEITNSVGVKKLVSEDDDYIGRLICEEMTENLAHVARAVARLSKKCSDPLLKSFERAFNDLIKIGADPYGWQFSWKKMERKLKKMERFIVTNTNLYQEMETLADLEQTLKRMKGNDNADSITLVEYEKKVAWKQQEVKHLKGNSLWNRTYDYTILLLARSVFTIYGRIGHVFGISNVADMGVKDSRVTDIHSNRRSHSTVFMQSSVYPTENGVPRFSTGVSGKAISVSGPLLRTNNLGNFHSGPLGNSMTTSSPISGKYNGVSFHSGPLGRSTSKSDPVPKANKTSFRLWQFRHKTRDAREKVPQREPNEITASGTFYWKHDKWKQYELLKFCKLLNPPPETLGAAALALHYANVIIFIEKLVASPHLIGNDARDDLYNMLPASIRAALRAKLKPYSKSLTASVYDTALAGEWNEAMSGTLEWLAPLAHNMIRWQSERSFEHQSLISKTNVLLVQTLYFANQERTEAAITELLVGLNYIWRFGREINAKSLVECGSGRTFDEYLD